jgi:acetoin utilization deacetylase AcuC-like enzyme
MHRLASHTPPVMAHRLPIVHHPAYEVDIGAHVFPTRKYRLVRECLLAEATIADADVVVPEPAKDEDVLRVHTSEYVRKIKSAALSIQERLVLEVPFSAELRQAMWLCAGGTILAGHLAVERGRAVHLGGGFHHAFPDHGEGFCLINDVAIAVRRLEAEGAIERAAVVDLDVHHGNGTAAIFRNDERVYTFSMHQQHNYPFWKPPSDLDVGLPDGIGDADYLHLLHRHLEDILNAHRPDIVFYLAGADPYREDQLGGLGLSIEGLARRDAMVFRLSEAAGAPVAVTLAGGYALEPDDTLEIHCNTVRAAVGSAALG